jgi:hypothetical protein
VNRIHVDDYRLNVAASAARRKLVPFTFNSNGNGTFMFGTTTTFATMFATKVKLVGFNIAGKLLTRRTDCATTKLLKPLPGCSITAEPEQIL